MTVNGEPPAARLAPGEVLAALALVRTGVVYSLETTRWHGMPLFDGHPPFQVLNYRTPAGIRNEADQTWLEPNDVGFAWHAEYMAGTSHTGTHIDALCHVTCGDDNAWFGGYTCADYLGDHGPLHADATEIPPLLTRGVLLDVAGARGVGALPAGDPIGGEELSEVAARQGVELRQGDVVLVRTGYGGVYGDVEAMAEHRAAGIDLSGANFLAEAGAVAVGGDTESLENLPSSTPGNPHPVHLALMAERGIYILEMLDLDEIARDRLYEFLFICLPLRIRGATGSMVRPVAVA